VNETHTLEKRWRAIGASGRQPRLLEEIKAVFERAIAARAPQNRPPGKAGLKAEKGYYRLLYLEGEFSAQAFVREGDGRQVLPMAWEAMAAILQQMTDIPELLEEIRFGIASAMRAAQEDF